MVSKVLSSICNIIFYIGIIFFCLFLMCVKVEVRLFYGFFSFFESYFLRFVDMLLFFDGLLVLLVCGICSG